MGKSTLYNYNFIKHIKRARRKHIMKLPTIYCAAVLLIAAVSCFVASYCLFESYSWLSELMLSLGGGFTTGLLLFAFSNLRANRAARIKAEYDVLSRINGTANEIIDFQSCYSYESLLHLEPSLRRSPIDDRVIILELLDKLQDEMRELPTSLFSTFKFEQYDPLDRDILNQHRDALISEEIDPAEIKRQIIALAKDMIKAADMIHEPMRQREDQLRFLSNSVI